MGKRPNIVFILTDDQGVWSLGCYGNREVIAPSLDKLAEEGVVFDNFFCTSPVCSPARASILTGLLPSQHGVVDWLAGGSIRKKDYEDIQVNLKRIASNLAKPVENLEDYPDDATVSFKETVSYQKYMPHEDEPIEYLKEFTGYTDVLVENGYVCGLTGKWHLGDSIHPQKGMTFWRTIARGGTQYMCPEYVRDSKLSIGEKYVTDQITDDALEFLERQAGSDVPFYLSIHYTAPHDPWEKDDQPQEVWNLYNDCPFDSVPIEPLNPTQYKANPHATSKEQRRYMLQGYYTTITAMDRGIGRIVEKLEKLGMKEDTILVFTSDNGFNMGHHGIWGKGNGTLPFNMFDTSVKVPMIVSGYRKNARCDELVSQYDVFQTILDMAGIDQSRYLKENMPGTSFLPLLTGEKQQVRDDVVIYDEYGSVRMIRTKEYKYVCRIPGGPDELYDLKNDPGERNNLIDNPDMRQLKIQLNWQLTQWFNRYVDPRYDASRLPMPTRLEEGKNIKTGQCNRIEELHSSNVVFPMF